MFRRYSRAQTFQHGLHALSEHAVHMADVAVVIPLFAEVVKRRLEDHPRAQFAEAQQRRQAFDDLGGRGDPADPHSRKEHLREGAAVDHEPVRVHRLDRKRHLAEILHLLLETVLEQRRAGALAQAEKPFAVRLRRADARGVLEVRHRVDQRGTVLFEDAFERVEVHPV